MESTQDFDAFLNQAWDDHVADAPGVAKRLASASLGLVRSDGDIAALTNLGHHVFGEHLGRWPEGVAYLQQLAVHPACTPSCAQALERCTASLLLCQGQEDRRAPLSVSDRIRVTALAAGNLAARDPARSRSLLDEALVQADLAALPDVDPAHRSIAASSNGIAGTLEEKTDRNSAERALMIFAAQVARRFWARAGTWLETERAEYRLAMSWLQAGDLPEARRHAQACQEIVQGNDGAALERFFAWEALGTVERAAGNTTGHQHALAAATQAFAELEDGDKGWCKASLDKLQG